MPEGNWKSGDAGINTSRRRLKEAFSRGLGEQLSALNKSEQGKLLLLGEIFLIWSETLPGRFIISVSALLIAWALL